ncbi:hypothetical protein GCM10010156_61500 [Planobispora rosea]|uniref:Phosphotyrosine protein phosphatase I domain-containing protein n=1 Tax=Planobispora rosea TaxID=35762 RepID=A0A8J3WH39_PLARO|nr:hypothetical protein [Planobispora rosea]GGS94927.1 hypothetical protein GCM10010156_61500 [Planobispora rosea]GIH87451.1 hypothetical protein Pro02_58590 [Planobispora rosea]
MGRTVLFVCPHGAGKSRIAAAWFARAAPPGWAVTTAGLEPQPQVSVHAPRLLAGSGVEHLLDEELPRPLSAITDPALTVTIDCPPGAVAGAVEWRLHHPDFDERMAAELRDRARELARELAREPDA